MKGVSHRGKRKKWGRIVVARGNQRGKEKKRKKGERRREGKGKKRKEERINLTLGWSDFL
jgi:hypothetical protein